MNYFKDIAESGVYSSIKNSHRFLFGIPLYKYKEFSSFYSSLLLKMPYYSMTKQTNKKFLLQLHHIKNARMIKLYLQKNFEKTS